MILRSRFNIGNMVCSILAERCYFLRNGKESESTPNSDSEFIHIKYDLTKDLKVLVG